MSAPKSRKTATPQRNVTKRGKPAAKRKPARGPSRINQLLNLMPFTEAQLQRAATWAILAAVGVGAYGVAHLYGVPEMARVQVAELADDAGFTVKRIEVRGANRVDELKVYDVMLAQKDRAMPNVDVEKLRFELLTLGWPEKQRQMAAENGTVDGVQQFGWIADARVSRQLPDTLVVDIVERVPYAAWKDGTKLSLVDRNGVVLEPVDEQGASGLRRISGRNAASKMVALNALLAEAPALSPHVSEAEWIGNRRWNVTFKSGETLALPEAKDEAVAAWINFARIDGVSGLLGSGVTYFDLRDPERAYLRKPKPQAADTKDNVEPSKSGGQET